MVSQAKVKLYGSKSRHSINLPSDFVRDSTFPFTVGEELMARIEGGKIIIEKKCSNFYSLPPPSSAIKI
jgi:hypothetical protein